MADLSVDQWIALNDEVAALVRAGLPLERGLMAVGQDMRGRLGNVATRVAQRLEQGSSLNEALDAETGPVPSVYRAVVEAGARSGRLASALEGLADYARGYVEMRRLLGLALLYPMIVLAMAYLLVLGFFVVLVPTFAASFEEFRLPGRWAFEALSPVSGTVRYWWPIGPVALLAVGFGWWWTGRGSAFGAGDRGPLRWVPGLGALLRLASWSAFTELLALLVEHEVPVAQAIELAGQSSGDAGLARSARSLASQVEQGNVTGASDAGLPPLVAWVLMRGEGDALLVHSLRQAAESYRRRAEIQGELVRTMVPVVLLALVGGLSVLVYALLLFAPMTALLHLLGQQSA